MLELRDLSEQVGEALQQQGLILVTAESCTGGGIAALVTDVPGSSLWFDRGFVTYSNTAKMELLDVPEELLNVHGAVSEPVVKAMVAGALRHSPADIALAVSGIAGPGGGTPEKPVGTVCLAWQRRGQPAEARTLHLPGSRDEIRLGVARAALEGVLHRLCH